MAPAPSPRGTANRQSRSRFPEQEKPNSAAAVREVEKAVILPVPKRRISSADSRLDMMVPPEISMVIRLPLETGIPNSV